MVTLLLLLSAAPSPYLSNLLHHTYAWTSGIASLFFSCLHLQHPLPGVSTLPPLHHLNLASLIVCLPSPDSHSSSLRGKPPPLQALSPALYSHYRSRWRANTLMTSPFPVRCWEVLIWNRLHAFLRKKTAVPKIGITGQRRADSKRIGSDCTEVLSATMSSHGKHP